MRKICLNDKMAEIKEPWTPENVTALNGQVIRLALFKGEYHWHSHKDEDELIFVYKGRIVVQFKDRPNVELSSGEMLAIPKCVEHCPKSVEDSFVLMFEPASLKSKGN